MAQNVLPPPPTEPYYVKCDANHIFAYATDLIKPLVTDANGNEVEGQGFEVVLEWPRLRTKFRMWRPDAEALQMWTATAVKFHAVFNPVSGRTSYTPDMAWVQEEAARQADRRREAHQMEQARRRRRREEQRHRHQRGGSSFVGGGSRPSTTASYRSITGYTPQNYHRTGPFPPPSRSRH
jgi:hypothetical protein